MKKYLIISASAIVLFASVFVGQAMASTYSQAISLKPGWNIISAPRVVESHSFSVPETSSNLDIFILDAANPAGWSTMTGEFIPLQGYFINNKATSTQTLTLNYKDGATPAERLFERQFTHTGWYSIGVANPTYAKSQSASAVNGGNAANILDSVKGNHSTVIDFTDSDFVLNPSSVAVGGTWKAAIPSNLATLNDLRETKGYAIYITNMSALYSGFQNTSVLPIIDSISPTAATAGGSNFTLTVNGSLLTASSTINWNGSPLITTFVSPTQITAIVPASNITSIGSAAITVQDLNPGSGTSNSKTFSILFATGLTASKDAGTPSTYAVAGNTNQLFAKFDILASGDSFRFNELDFSYAGGSPISNFRVVDDQGVQIGTTGSILNPGSTYQAGTGSLNYIIPANATRVLTVYGDLASTATGTVTITMGGGATSAQSYTTLNTASFSAVGANQLSVLSSATNLAAALNNGLGAPVNAAAGSANMKIASFVLTAGQVNAVNLTGVTMTATSSATLMAFVRNVRVMVGSAQLGSTQSTVTQGSANTFNSNAPITINSNGNVIVDVYADISSSVTASSSAVFSLSGVNASTAAGTAVTLSSSVVGQSVSFNNGGALTGALAGATPSASYLGMGVNGVTLATYQFNSNNAGGASVTAVNIYDLSTTTSLYGTGTAVSSTLLAANKAGDQASFYNYRLVDGVTTVSTANVDTNGLLSFNLAGVPVAVSNYKTISLVADVNAFPYASSSGAHSYQMTGFNYTNSAGSTTATSSVSGNVFTVYRTNLTVAKGAGAFTALSSVSGVGTIVGQYDFSATSGYDVLVKTISMSQSGALIAATSSMLLGIYDAAAPSVLLISAASSTLSGTTASTFTLSGSGWNIPAGTTKTLLVKVTESPAAPRALVVVTAGTGSYQTQITGVTWNDSQVTIGALSPSIATPIGGQTISGISN